MISVIVPVFNTYRYLKKCISSVLSQTYTDFELILVNDCSTDQSLSICEYFAKIDKRVKVINKAQNEGVDKARFSGLDVSTGDSVFFLDSDDWLNINALRLLKEEMDRRECEIVVGGGRRFISRIPILSRQSKRPDYVNSVIEHDEFMEKYYIGYFGYNVFPVNIWGTLYKRKVIDLASLQPCGVSFGEDLVFNMKVMPFANRIAVIGDAIYNYRVEVGKKWKYENKWLSNARLVYRLKCEFAEKYDVKQGLFFTNIELINLVKTYVDFAIDIKNVPRERKIMDLRKELEHNEYENLIYLLGSRYKAQNLVEMFLKKDAEGNYQYVEMRHNDITFSQRIKRFLKSLL